MELAVSKLLEGVCLRPADETTSSDYPTEKPRRRVPEIQDDSGLAGAAVAAGVLEVQLLDTPTIPAACAAFFVCRSLQELPCDCPR